jgi:ubiquitin-protein ligase
MSEPNTEKVRVLCPYCRAKIDAPVKLLGQERPCPGCKKVFLIQENKPVAVPPKVLPQYAMENVRPQQPEIDKIKISFDDIPTNPSQSVNVPIPLERKLSPRQRRLQADYENVSKGLAKSRYIRISRIEGNPPDMYFIDYNVRGIEAVHGEQIVYRNQHSLKIQLTAGYPREQPKCQLFTPIFHPNFEPAVVCIGDHWTAQERLIDLIIRIGEMIAYQSYNVKSPLDGEAAMWADLHQYLFPIDKSDLMPPE